METRFLDVIIAEIKEIIETKSFVCQEDGSYRNEDYCFKIEYNEESKLYSLFLAATDDQPEYKEMSTWIFDDTKTEKDAAVIGKDFCETLMQKMGIAPKRKTTADIPLPTKSAAGKSVDINGMAQRLLAVFPTHKDAYRDHVAQNGEFLYITFLNETIVPDIRAAIDAGSKKPLKKIFDALGELYVDGNRAVQNAVAVTIVTGAVGDSKERYETVLPFMEENQYLKTAVVNLRRFYDSKNKKLRTMINK